jgi:hypothetical protein
MAFLVFNLRHFGKSKGALAEVTNVLKGIKFRVLGDGDDCLDS